MAQPISGFPISPEENGAVQAPPVPHSRKTEFPVYSTPAASESKRGLIQRSFWKTYGVFSDTISAVSRHARYFADERPLQLLAGIAAASFLLGAALRVWRSSRHA